MYMDYFSRQHRSVKRKEPDTDSNHLCDTKLHSVLKAYVREEDVHHTPTCVGLVSVKRHLWGPATCGTECGTECGEAALPILADLGGK
jgi:hypothetical protein